MDRFQLECMVAKLNMMRDLLNGLVEPGHDGRVQLRDDWQQQMARRECRPRSPIASDSTEIVEVPPPQIPLERHMAEVHPPNQEQASQTTLDQDIAEDHSPEKEEAATSSRIPLHQDMAELRSPEKEQEATTSRIPITLDMAEVHSPKKGQAAASSQSSLAPILPSPAVIAQETPRPLSAFVKTKHSTGKKRGCTLVKVTHREIILLTYWLHGTATLGHQRASLQRMVSALGPFNTRTVEGWRGIYLRKVRKIMEDRELLAEAIQEFHPDPLAQILKRNMPPVHAVKHIAIAPDLCSDPEDIGHEKCQRNVPPVHAVKHIAIAPDLCSDPEDFGHEKCQRNMPPVHAVSDIVPDLSSDSEDYDHEKGGWMGITKLKLGVKRCLDEHNETKTASKKILN